MDGATAEELEIKTYIELSKAVTSAEELASEMYGTEVMSVETDNAPNMVAMGENRKHTDWHNRCGAHGYNFLVKHIILEQKELNKKV